MLLTIGVETEGYAKQNIGLRDQNSKRIAYFEYSHNPFIKNINNAFKSESRRFIGV